MNEIFLQSDSRLCKFKVGWGTLHVKIYIKLFTKKRPFKVSIFLNAKLSKFHAQMLRLIGNFNKTNKISYKEKFTY
jgi:hypothetical protein